MAPLQKLRCTFPNPLLRKERARLHCSLPLRRGGLGWGFLLVGLILLTARTASADALFSDADRARIVTYWSAPGRYIVSVPEQNQGAPWQVRLTPDGSVWLHRYQQAIGAGKAPPTADPTKQSGGVASWKEWTQKKAAYDRWLAQQTANRLNAAVAAGVASADPRSRAALPVRGGKRGRRTDLAKPDTAPTDGPQAPGPIPADLLAAAGDPPSLAASATPMQHTVTFDDNDVYGYQDHTNVPVTYAYYRFPQGVGTSGTPLPDAERTALFTAAGLTETQRRVMMAVSKFEGSFDAVNTYDTGYVSVGFIQFITLDDGRHSLADVLAHEKTDSPAEFERDFRRFGIDLTTDRVVAVVDPATGAELTGPDAVRKIVDDKRLIAVFQRAGKTSTAFRVAQIRVAKENYWPEDDMISVTVNGQTLSGKVSDVVKSEAGLATFFDRKVNRGNVLPLPDVVAQIMAAHNLTQMADAALYEKEIVSACKYRGDFLADKSLKQPDNQGN